MLRAIWSAGLYVGGATQVVASSLASGRRGRSGAASSAKSQDMYKVELSDGTVEALTKWQVEQAVDDYKRQEKDGWITQGA